jgi:hypothetical protein
MKRDMDLIRTILQRVESDESARPKQPLEIPEHTPEEINYHIALLNDAGFVDATIRGSGQSSVSLAAIQRLTWHGHEFLDAARDDTIWRKAKEHFLKPTASWTVSLLFEWLKQEAHRKLFGVPSSS